jgi:hypothetical protein
VRGDFGRTRVVRERLKDLKHLKTSVGYGQSADRTAPIFLPRRIDIKAKRGTLMTQG